MSRYISATEHQLELVARLRLQLPGLHPPMPQFDYQARNEIDRLLVLKTKLIEEEH